MTEQDKTLDPDLPGDKNFRPTNGGAFIINTIGGPAWAMADTISAEEQAAAHHNRLRYHELWRERHGMPNRYAETRYR